MKHMFFSKRTLIGLILAGALGRIGVGRVC